MLHSIRNRMPSVKVSNITNENQAFDDQTLRPGTNVTVTGYSDDMLQGWAQKRLLLDPAPDAAEVARLMTINPCQLPLPVRLIGGFQGLYTPSVIKDSLAFNVTETDVIKVLGSDSSRVNFRFRNIGSVAIAFGGASVTFNGSAIIIGPGEVFDERYAPNVAWYAIAEQSPGSAIVGMSINT